MGKRHLASGLNTRSSLRLPAGQTCCHPAPSGVTAVLPRSGSPEDAWAGARLSLCSAALVPLAPLPARGLHLPLNGGRARGGAPANTPAPAGGGECALPPVPLPLGADARAFVPVTPPGSSEWKTAGGSFPAPRPQRWHEREQLCLASPAALPAPGQAPVLTPLLSPQVVPESGARERERHAAQQAGQVRPSRHCCGVLCLAWDPLVTRKRQLLPG